MIRIVSLDRQPNIGLTKIINLNDFSFPFEKKSD